MFMYLGLARVMFTNDETGEVIQGWNLWVAEEGVAPSAGLIPVKKWFTDSEYDQMLAPLGGAAGLAKYAGREVQLILSLKGRIKGISFPQK